MSSWKRKKIGSGKGESFEDKENYDRLRKIGK
jgi:hypothetical protein